MFVKEIKVNADTMKAEIDLMENATYIVKDGKVDLVDNLPNGFGKQIITWQNGKPTHTELSYTKKI